MSFPVSSETAFVDFTGVILAKVIVDDPQVPKVFTRLLVLLPRLIVLDGAVVQSFIPADKPPFSPSHLTRQIACFCWDWWVRRKFAFIFHPLFEKSIREFYDTGRIVVVDVKDDYVGFFDSFNVLSIVRFKNVSTKKNLVRDHCLIKKLEIRRHDDHPTHAFSCSKINFNSREGIYTLFLLKKTIFLTFIFVATSVVETFRRLLFTMNPSVRVPILGAKGFDPEEDYAGFGDDFSQSFNKRICHYFVLECCSNLLNELLSE